jgi:hypothetical protein
MVARSFDLSLVDATGQVILANAEADCRNWTEDGLHKTEVRLVVRWAAGEVLGVDWNYFAALCRVREQLAALGLTPRCYGACRNLVLSGMCLDMALGGKGYLARLGQPTGLSDLVSIFASGPDMDLASVAEQEEFKRAWLRSLERLAEQSGTSVPARDNSSVGS